MKSGKPFSAPKGFALAFGLFLGLCLWKFGNPVILDSKIPTPVSAADFLNDPWPTRWASWILLPLALIGIGIAIAQKLRWQGTHWLWLLPGLWLGWQFVSAAQTVDASLTAATLWQLSGCVAGYFLGALFFSDETRRHWLLLGVLAAFTFCLMRAVDQRLFEFPETRLALVEGERCGWTNFPPEILLELKRDAIIVSTNGVEVANPAILAKFAKGRVHGTLVYPNALAGAVLLLFPAAIALAFNRTKNLRPMIRGSVIALTLFLGLAGLFWSGSKLGWLVAVAVGGICLLRLNWPARWKWAALTLVLLVGLGVFAVRFQNYFAAGATSAGARFDYWRAAAQTAGNHPLLGTGPGTFQRPYAQLKSPAAEMARLTHNDYLEQFSDSGIPGGIFYAAWIVLALWLAGRRVWNSSDGLNFAVFIGLLGWFVQGIGEFSLYIPALAWTAFTLLGSLVSDGKQRQQRQTEQTRH